MYLSLLYISVFISFLLIIILSISGCKVTKFFRITRSVWITLPIIFFLSGRVADRPKVGSGGRHRNLHVDKNILPGFQTPAFRPVFFYCSSTVLLKIKKNSRRTRFKYLIIKSTKHTGTSTLSTALKDTWPPFRNSGIRWPLVTEWKRWKAGHPRGFAGASVCRATQ